MRTAAAAVGKSARSAYQLRDRPGGEHFAVAWDAAMQLGKQAASDAALSIAAALDGESVSALWRGKQVGVRQRHKERLLIATLAGGRMLRPEARTGIDEERDRLERWDVALRRREMNLDDGVDDAREGAAFEHGIWLAETKATARREKAAEIRAAVKQYRAKVPIPGPRVRLI